ncbi:loricrin, putative [Trichomonas vaginalis G3]|uniref:receptor protein-tyrosine kinase n=1 Tax=Trichomonas vaginalis (strain ATCC PRA-98 / G3) TaxID=412133 RepID=A2FN88_TRIV3|nr:glycine-rich protein family [Trichomonas vaginalis G3]EAX93616.1 loricrin, putative [Trichomonas vaginalis G3]KAI5496129.1 glycine-rich protein family [Trichomonas vaginalis G3]|eukprot:XP_001306546.1 loricrin [Trichomonas vaginalis G3]
MFLYLGGRGQDQSDTSHSLIPASGGWNFGGQGGIDLNPENETGPGSSLENGAGGGGAVDIRLEYADINNIDRNSKIFNKSIMSRIIVAGSGGGACSGNNFGLGIPKGFPGGNSSALSNGPYTFGGTQTDGKLGIGMDGISGHNNEGGSGGCGSGYRGGFSKFPLTSAPGTFEVGGTGGSSYIKTREETNQFMIDHPDLFFSNNIIISGKDNMPSPYNNSYITGHVGHGVCRITVLNLIIRCTCICSSIVNLSLLFVSSGLS